MNFPIEIRHMATGLAKVFHSLEDLAAHLRENVKEEWEGWTHLRLHPALAALDEPVADVPDALVSATYGSNIGVTGDGEVHVLVPGEMPPEMASQVVSTHAAASTSEAPSEVHAEEPAAAPAAEAAPAAATVDAPVDAPAAAVGHDPAQDITGS